MNSPHAIAIVGMACRFPGAQTVEDYWANLRSGRESIRWFSDSELGAAGVPEPLRRNPAFVPACGALDDIERFDAAFFGFTPREAEITDPQHRVFLEVAWEALEDAGIEPQHDRGRIGVYAGAGLSTYLLHNLLPHGDLSRFAAPVQILMANNKDYVPTRVSYKLNLRGPSINVNTACSSSLVAVHLACQALLAYDCDVALAGGVGIQVPQEHGYIYEPDGILSPDGHCRAFDADARGTVSGNGAGIVVLKRLEEAVTARDGIRAVILGSAINNDGASKAGYTAPSLTGQAEVIAEALAVAGVAPETIGYIEAHGTGTPVGDPIEIRALTDVFRRHTARRGFCAIGSVKANVGHLDEAAGVAGLIKAVLAVERGEIPPSLHFRVANPACGLDDSPFYVSTSPTTFPVAGTPKRAGVSSFGIGGTNAHVVVEQAPQLSAVPDRRPAHLLALSARSAQALAAQVSRLADHLESQPDSRIADVAYTLQTGRRAFAHRMALVCATRAGAVGDLRRWSPRLAGTSIPDSAPAVIFMFPGQGTQHVGMARELYDHEAVFRAAVDDCADRIAALAGWDLRTYLYPQRGASAADEEVLRQTAIAQPSLFAIEYALARLWMSWGVHPSAMIGHSVGEYVAACIAGVFTLEQALALIVARGRLMQSLPIGSMAAVDLDEAAAQRYLADRQRRVAIAAVNGPRSCVLSGQSEDLGQVIDRLKREGVDVRPLQTSHAFHSPMMQPIVETLGRQLSTLALGRPAVPFIANVSGDWITDSEATAPGYWTSQICATVRFGDGVDRLAVDRPGAIWLELGPGHTLCGHVRASVGRDVAVPSLPHPKASSGAHATTLRALGHVWMNGVNIAWNEVSAGDGRRRVPLPTYPFERKRYWIDPPRGNVRGSEPVTATDAALPPRALPRGSTDDWLYSPVWTSIDDEVRSGSQTETLVLFMPGVGEPGGEAGDAILSALTRRGARIISVRPGSAYCRDGADSYEIRTAEADDYEVLLSALTEGGSLPHRFVHLWSLTGSQPPADEEILERGFDSLLLLARALEPRLGTAGAQIVAVTDGIERVTGREPIHPAKAAILGPLRVTPLESPALTCRHVDVDAAGFDSRDATAVDSVAADIMNASPEHFSIAHRGGRRWVRRFQQVRPSLDRLHDASPLRDGGLYLITGGLGSMGLAFAERIAKRARATLVLVGRSGLDDPSTSFTAAELKLMETRETAHLAAPSAPGPSPGPALDALRRLCTRLILEYLSASGLDFRPGARYLEADIDRHLATAPDYRPMVGWFLDVLAEHRHIERADGIVEGRWDGSGETAAQLLARIRTDHPAVEGIATLVSYCVTRYGDVLTGRMNGTSVLYPDGTSRLLDDHSARTTSVSSDAAYLRLLADYLHDRASENPERPLRILEVGGGTGALTDAVLSRLVDCRIEYTFSDLSHAFLASAEAEARRRGLGDITFARFDISRDPVQQGLRTASFDIVIGYNVVHATPDLRVTLGHLARLLVPGGRLCLIETVETTPWDQMTWGLTTGWWAFDDGIRHGSPLLDLGRWEAVLAETGFEAVAFPRERSARKNASAGLIIGCAPSPAGATRADRIRERIAGIEAQGSRVVVVKADVSSAVRMRSVVSETRERFGRITGVIHAAGVIGHGPIRNKTISQARRVLLPKLGGARALADALASEPPGFFILCSSLAAHGPIAGQVDYAGANAALDAFARWYAQETGTFTVSIGWGFWQELGMIEQSAMPPAEKDRIVAEIRENGWSTAGVDIFETILLRCDGPEILVSPGNAAGPLTVSRGTRPLKSPHPLLEVRQDERDHVAYVGRVSTASHWVLDEHRLDGRPILPGTAFLELARAAYAEQHGLEQVRLVDVCFVQPFVLEPNESREIRVILRGDRDRGEFFVVSQAETDRWRLHARGDTLSLSNSDRDRTHVVGGRTGRPELSPEVRAEFERRMTGFGPHWRNVQEAYFDGNHAQATLQLDAGFEQETSTFGLHPALFDNATGYFAVQRQTRPRVPFAYGAVTIRGPLRGRIVSHATAHGEPGAPGESFDAVVTDLDGRILAEVERYTFRSVEPAVAIARRPAVDNAALELLDRGSLESLAFRPAPRQPPGDGEVEIEVRAVGLNFIEVLYALGLLPELQDRRFPFGLECAGVVSATGRGVSALEPGDAVIAYTNGTASLFVTAPAYAVARVPAALSLDQAATIPASYVTAYAALIEQGRLRRRERVLIHSACGGVGLAALHVARWRGAEVLATAGTSEKHDYLRSLGVGTVMHSRTTGFAAETMRATSGEGVDVVLNSLAGEFIDLGMSVLRRHGRFLELGKRDILQGSQLSLRHFSRQLSFIAVDVGPDLPEFERVWRTVVQHVAAADFPPLPYRAFPAVDAAEAFAAMTKGRHVGKILLSFADSDAIRAQASTRRRSRDDARPLAEIIGLADVPERANDLPINRSTGVLHPPAIPAAAAMNDTERTIAAIWEDLLGTSVQRDDNFFALNGDSLVGARVVARIHHLLGVKLPLSVLFDHPTVAQLAACVHDTRVPDAALASTAAGTVGEQEEGVI